jgi:hypothetical protein
MLESQLPELRQRLEAAGVNIQRFDVATDANSGGWRNPHREAASDFAQRVASVEAPVARPRPRTAPAGAGSLDVTV